MIDNLPSDFTAEIVRRIVSCWHSVSYKTSPLGMLKSSFQMFWIVEKDQLEMSGILSLGDHVVLVRRDDDSRAVRSLGMFSH